MDGLNISDRTRPKCIVLLHDGQGEYSQFSSRSCAHAYGAK